MNYCARSIRPGEPATPRPARAFSANLISWWRISTLKRRMLAAVAGAGIRARRVGFIRPSSNMCWAYRSWPKNCAYVHAFPCPGLVHSCTCGIEARNTRFRLRDAAPEIRSSPRHWTAYNLILGYIRASFQLPLLEMAIPMCCWLHWLDLMPVRMKCRIFSRLHCVDSRRNAPRVGYSPKNTNSPRTNIQAGTPTNHVIINFICHLRRQCRPRGSVSAHNQRATRVGVLTQA